MPAFAKPRTVGINGTGQYGTEKGNILKQMDNHFLQGIDTVILRVSDIKKSKEWYTQKLGLKEIHHDEKLKLVVLDTFSPTSLTIWETDEKIEPNPRTTTYPIFKTIDAKAAPLVRRLVDWFFIKFAQEKSN